MEEHSFENLLTLMFVSGLGSKKKLQSLENKVNTSWNEFTPVRQNILYNLYKDYGRKSNILKLKFKEFEDAGFVEAFK